MIKFYTNPMSRGRVVRWALEEAGCDYETILLEYGTTMKAPEYLAINPMGKVPAIKHGDAVVTETPAICHYIAEAFPESGLLPDKKDAKAVADYYRWLFFSAGPLEAAVTNKHLGVEIANDKRGFVGYGSYETAIKAVSDFLDGRQYVAGNKFSAADIFLSSLLGFYTTFGIVETNPVFERYVTAMKSRPAYVKADSIDNGLMAKKAS